ncbi:pyridoxamine 5'-phosphate oxidase [Wenzhouxiangella sp. AB-CW3]|uniref:pyridoxamine 5'-phosphate oxidase n=1 Tax=Wenzhouxiangella sp. AB-CW3 TaxID=2771012 RepID=UPI00168B0167|nr:pyridoxamine 5'-phosphate oxidase [Wenzhouxiangella sp. AB-CW3]QOC22426.1 pyridoxamine 5'-phosphate oxidase [Wenzhouxiangella sp. AB-CW3]
MTTTTDLTAGMVERFRDGFDRAVAAGVPEPTAMTLATVDASGRPTARTVLLKDMDEQGFVFYTNLESRKGRHLNACPDVALVFWWRELAEQVLVEGRVEAVSNEEADAYFASRPRGSQIGAWASLQSSELPSRQDLLDRVREYEQRYAGQDVPRPPHWSGYRVKPRQVEFWYGRESRLHERVCYRHVAGDWQETLLYP